MKYPWKKINGNRSKIERFIDIMNKWIPTCPVNYVLRIVGAVNLNLVKRSEIYYLEDKEHEAVISFAYANGIDMWKLAHLAFEGELNDEIFRKYREIICDFMAEKGVPKLYTYRPKQTPLPKMQQFFAHIEDSTWWKLDPEDVMMDDERGSHWILKLSNAVDL